MLVKKTKGFVVAAVFSSWLSLTPSYANQDLSLAVGSVALIGSGLAASFLINDTESADTSNADPNKASSSSSKPEVKFTQVIAPEKPGVPFTTKIAASSDNSVPDSRVYLHSILGHVTPGYIDLKDGQWHGSVAVSEVGNNNYLKLRWYDKNGVAKTSDSNSFSAADGGQYLANDGTLKVKIINNNLQPISDAVITLYANDPAQGDAPILFSDATNSNGEYTFNNLQPGIYFLAIKKTGYRDKVKKISAVSQRTLSENIKLTFSCDTNKKVPILLVPGIMGSYAVEKSYWLWPYPTLPAISPEWDSDELAVLDPFGYVGWTNITKTFEALGYIKDCTIFTVPYDWSLSIPVISDKYLAPWIEQAKKVSGSDKVDIVAHSMGGLVARSYIQSEKYSDDVRKFVMLGTPNKGADSIYYIWESGDPITLDKALRTPSMLDPTAYFYTNTLSYFYRDRLHGHACKYSDIRRYEPLYCDKDKVYDVSHRKALSSGQLIPIYNDALLKTGDINKSLPIVKEENTFLKALNNIPCFNPNGCVDSEGKLYSYKDPKSIFVPNEDPSKVQTILFRGVRNETIGSIAVTPQSKGYDGRTDKDGIPQNMILPNSGDGTVLAKSVDLNEYLDPDSPLVIKEKNSLHSYLVANFIPEIVEFITDSPLPASLTPFKTQESLVMGTNGRVQINLDGMTFNNLPILQEIILQNEHKVKGSNIALKTAADGIYKVSLTSPYNESYELAISYYDKNTNKLFAQTYLGYFDGSLKDFNFVIDTKNSNNPIIFGRNFQTPSDLNIINQNGRIGLSWQDTVGTAHKDVIEYEIYWKKNYEHSFNLLGRTSNSLDRSYITYQPWEEVGDNVYAVRARLNNGESTFFSQPVFFVAQEKAIVNPTLLAQF